MNIQTFNAPKQIFALIKQRECYMVNKKQQCSYSPGKKNIQCFIKTYSISKEIKKIFHKTNMALKATNKF